MAELTVISFTDKIQTYSSMEVSPAATTPAEVAAVTDIPLTTSTVYITKTYTIGESTITSVVAVSTTVCPVSSAQSSALPTVSAAPYGYSNGTDPISHHTTHHHGGSSGFVTKSKPTNIVSSYGGY
jgi:hypothetical protein